MKKIAIIFFALIASCFIVLGMGLLFIFVVFTATRWYVEGESGDYPKIGRDTECVLGNGQYQLHRGYHFPEHGEAIRDYTLLEYSDNTHYITLVDHVRKYKFYWGTLCMIDAEGSYWTFDDSTGELKDVSNQEDLSKGLKKTFEKMNQ